MNIAEAIENRNASSRQSTSKSSQASAMPTRANPPLQPFAQRLAAFRAKGFGPYILPLIPVNTRYRVWNKTKKQHEMTTANGKNC